MNKKLFLTILFFVVLVLCVNIPCFATFEIQDFTINAELSEEGNLHVTEKITYYTNEYTNGLTRKIITKNQRNTTNSADSLELYSVKVDGEICKQVENAFKGQNGVFEYSSKGNKEYNIKLYSPFYNASKVVEYEYLLNNVAVKYNDTGEIFWNFIGDEWDCNINNLNINITLPEAAANDTIYVFGHGSDDGTFTKNNNYITLNARWINAYQPIDARILFSKNAIANCDKIVNKNVLYKYINQEEGLSSEMEPIKILGNYSVKELAIILSIIVIIAGIILYFLFDKEIRVEKHRYFRELPFGLEPELLQYIYYGKVKSNSYYIAVLNLVKLGVYKLENTVNKVGKETQKLIYNENHTANLKDYQKNMVTTINGFLAEDTNGEKSLDLISLASKMERTTGSGFRKYESSLEAEKEGLVGKPAKIPKKIIAIAAIAMISLIAIISASAFSICEPDEVAVMPVFLGFITFIYSIVFSSAGGAVPVLIFLIFHCGAFQGAIIAMMVSYGIGWLYVPYIMLFILIQYLLRVKKFPKEERQIVEQVAGLRRYIKHYSLLKDKDSLEYIELWEDYFIMAIALGLNTKTINYFYNYGRGQNTNLGYSMHSTASYMHFHHHMYTSFYNYQRSCTHIQTSSGSGRSYSGSRGGFSGGRSSGGRGGRRWRRRTLLK